MGPDAYPPKDYIVISKASILKAAAEVATRKANEAQRRASLAETRAAKARRAEELRESIARAKLERAHWKDLALVRKQEGRETALENVARSMGPHPSPTQHAYFKMLREVIARDAEAVALAQARIIQRGAELEAARIIEQQEYDRSRMLQRLGEISPPDERSN